MTTASTERLPSLDGWRAVSILLVIGAHCRQVEGFPPTWTRAFVWLFDGDLGVRCFFFISGLLITWLLLREQRSTGAISLRDFYARRVLRIFPVYFAFLFVLFVLTLTTDFRQQRTTWIGNLTFTTNFTEREWTSAHLWSLAVEEQFYLLWPICLVIALSSSQPHRWVALGLAAAVVTAPVVRVLTYMSHHGLGPFSPIIFPEYSFFNYFDSIALGCAAAFVMIQSPRVLDTLKNRASAWAAVAALLILVPYVLQRLFLAGKIMVPLAQTMQNAGLGILILQSIRLPSAAPYSFLNFRLMQWIGVLSYSLYIWQEIFCTRPAVFGITGWFPGFPTWILFAFAVAIASYYGFERPLLGLRRRFRHVKIGRG